MSLRFMLAAGLLLGATASAVAESRLYQWTDESGRTHFSDRAPPASAVATATHHLDNQPRLPPVRQLRPAPLPAGKLQWLALALPDFTALRGRNDLGRVHVAGDCINPSVIGWRELQDTSSPFYEKNGYHLAQAMTQELRARGFSNIEVVTQAERWRLLEGYGAYRLVPKVIGLDVRACLSRHTGNQVLPQQLPQLLGTAADRAGVWLKLRWELWAPQGRAPVKVFETEGARLQWQEATTLNEMARQAVREATGNLTGYPALAAALAVRTPVTPAAPAGSLRDTLQEKASGLYDALVGSHMQRARVAQALAAVGPLRTQLTSHYQEHGRWPLNLQELGVSANLAQPGLISDVRLGVEGELVVFLAPEIGDGAHLRLRPTPGDYQVTWSCSSNLPESALGGPQGFCTSAP